MRNQLINLLKQAAIPATERQLIQWLGLIDLLVKWNKAYNLTSIRNPEDMLIKHILDSLVVGSFLEGDRFIDVGTGPGLPGLPLAILYPEKEFFLLDSLGKRIRFIQQAIIELGIMNVTAVQSRVEDYQPSVLFDGVLSRAFASTGDMLMWCQHLAKSGGYYLALKGQLQIEDSYSAIPDIIWTRNIKLDVPTLDAQRHLVIFTQQ